MLAMKVLRKDQIKRGKDVEHTLAERDVMTAVRSPFLVRLRYAFQVGACRSHIGSHCVADTTKAVPGDGLSPRRGAIHSPGSTGCSHVEPCLD